MPIAPLFPTFPIVTRAASRSVPAPLLTEEQRADMFASLGDKVVGMLQYTAETLDKPGSALRGLLAGQPEQLLNLIPFSDTMGITNPEERVYGRDLLEKMGFASPNQEGLFNSPGDFAADVGGFALDVALDPLWLVNLWGKSLTKAGLEATKAGSGALKAMAGKTLDATEVLDYVKQGPKVRMGSTPAAMIEELAKEQRTLGSLRVPFAEAPFYSTNFGLAPETAAKLVGALHYGRFSPVPWARNILSPIVGGVSPKSFEAMQATSKEFDEAVQQGKAWAKPGSMSYAQYQQDIAAAELHNLTGRIRDVTPVIQRESVDLSMLFDDLAKHHAVDLNATRDFKAFSRAMAELEAGADTMQRASAPQIAAMFNQSMAPEAVTEFSSRFHSYLDTLVGIKDDLYGKYLELGGVGGLLEDDYILHFPRRPSNRAAAKAWDKTFGKALFDPKTPFASGRKSILKYIPGGTLTINKMSRDPLLTATLDYTGDWLRTAAKTAKKSQVVGTGKALEEDLLAALRDIGVTDFPMKGKEITTSELQELYAYHKYLKPAAEGLGVTDPDEYARLFRGFMEKPPLSDEIKAVLAELGYNADEAGMGVDEAVAILGALGDDELRAALAGMSERPGAAARVRTVLPESEAATAEVRARPAPFDRTKAAGPSADPDDLADVAARVKSVREFVAETKARAAKGTRYPGVAEELSAYLRKLPSEVLETGLFDRSLFQDWADYVEHTAKALSNIRSAHGFLRGVAKLADSEAGEGMVPLREAWAVGGDKPLLHPRGLQVLARDYAEQLQRANPAEFARLKIDPNDVDGLIDRMVVPEKASDVLRQYTEFTKPGTQTWIGEVYDKMLGAFRFGVTQLFPGFHMRNGGDGLARNLGAGGADSYSIKGLSKRYRDAFNYLRGKSDLDYIDEIIDLDVASPGASRFLRSEAPEQSEAHGGFLNIFQTMRGRGIRSVTVAEEPRKLRRIWANIKAGTEEAYNYVEFLNRAPPYAALRDAGLTPSQAKAFVDRVQYDYLETSRNFAAEKVFRRVFPFWGFISKNIPYQIAQLFNSPGGRHAQTLRLMNAMRQSTGEDAPDWLKERMAVRLGGPAEQATFLRQFGLSIEDLSDLSFKDGRPQTARLFERLISKSTPALTLPYKFISGRDPYTGRDVKNLAPVTGSPTVDTVLYATPFSRAISTGQMLADTRKSPGLRTLNFLTGMKVGTYDLPQQMLYELKRRQYEDLRDYPEIRTFERASLPKDKPASAAAVKKMEDIRKVEALIRALRNERESL